MARLFLAVPLSQEARTDIETTLRSSVRGVPGRAVPPANWHLTLRFVGEATAQQQSRLIDGLESASWGTGGIVVLGGFGAFPRAARATVFWLGIESGEDIVARLAATGDQVVLGAGFGADSRPYQAHLTLSRLREPDDVRPYIDALPSKHTPMPVTEVVLYRSHLGAGPPRYESIVRIPIDHGTVDDRPD